MDRSSYLFILFYLGILFCPVLSSTCPVSRQCTCSSDLLEDITCDLSENGLPVFNGHDLHVSYSTVVIKGSAHLPNFLFYGLRVKGVQLVQLNITYIPCHLFSGLEADLRSIDLSKNLLKSVPSCTLIGLDRITHLNLSMNEISNIDEDSFSWLPSLVFLDLSQNKIVKIEVDSFADFPLLVQLDISQNRILSIPPNGFQGLRSVVLLNMSDNYLLDLRKDILTGLGKVELIDISRNKLARIHDDAFQPTSSLKTLDMSYNQLTLLTIRHIEDLQNLTLRNNKIQRLLEYVFTSCRELQLLDLSGNSMLSVPAFIFLLPKLRHISVANNKIEHLQFPIFTKRKHPFSFMNFSGNNISYISSANLPAESIFKLSFSKNRMVTMPNITVSSFAKNYSATSIDFSSNLLEQPTKIRCVISHRGDNKIYLNLANNKLKTITNVQPDVHSVIPVSLKSTRISYDLSKNLLETFPPCTFFLRYKLDLLDLSSNRLTWLPKGGCIGSAVRKLVLNGNKLNTIERIFFGGVHDNVPILTSVSFFGNKIASVSPDTFDGLSSLQNVDLRYNVLKSVPQKVLSVSSLSLIRLEGNPLNCDCSTFGKRVSLNATYIIDNARCVSPTDRRAYLFKCVLYDCVKTSLPLECTEDKFVGLQVNISHLDGGFSISWILYGPGEASSIRLNVTDRTVSTPVYIHLIDARINNFTFVNINPGHNYIFCVEALGHNGVRLNSHCFSGLKFIKTKKDKESSPKTPAYNNWLVIVCFILALLLVALCIYVCIRCRHSGGKTSSIPIRRGRVGWRERSNSSLIVRILQCMKLSRIRYDTPSGNSVIMSDLLMNEHYSDADRHRDSNPQRVSVDQIQPPLPPRNTSLTESVPEPPRSTSAEGADPGKDYNSGSKVSLSKNSTDSNIHNRNVYESGFNLRVNLGKPELSSPELSDEENIYEDTTPLDSPVVPKPNATSSPRLTQGAIPKVIYTQPNRQAQNKISNMDGSDFSMGGSDQSISGYECPVVHEIQPKEDSGTKSVPESVIVFSDVKCDVNTSFNTPDVVNKRPIPTKRNKQVPCLNNPTYSKVVPNKSKDDEATGETKDVIENLQKSCISELDRPDSKESHDFISSIDYESTDLSDRSNPRSNSPSTSSPGKSNDTSVVEFKARKQ